MDKKKYHDPEYYKHYPVKVPSPTEGRNPDALANTGAKSYGMHYLFSFLIPLAGVIMVGSL